MVAERPSAIRSLKAHGTGTGKAPLIDFTGHQCMLKANGRDVADRAHGGSTVASYNLDHQWRLLHGCE